MMKDGSLVLITSAPLKAPISSESTRATATAGQNDQPKPPPASAVTSTMIVIPAKPTIDPIERSNSPAIINRATATARIPRGAAVLSTAAVACQLTKLLSNATTARKT